IWGSSTTSECRAWPTSRGGWGGSGKGGRRSRPADRGAGRAGPGPPPFFLVERVHGAVHRAGGGRGVGEDDASAAARGAARPCRDRSPGDARARRDGGGGGDPTDPAARRRNAGTCGVAAAPGGAGGVRRGGGAAGTGAGGGGGGGSLRVVDPCVPGIRPRLAPRRGAADERVRHGRALAGSHAGAGRSAGDRRRAPGARRAERRPDRAGGGGVPRARSEEHTSEL